MNERKKTPQHPPKGKLFPQPDEQPPVQPDLPVVPPLEAVEPRLQPGRYIERNR